MELNIISIENGIAMLSVGEIEKDLLSQVIFSH